MDQSNDPADLETTQSIRKALMSDDALSFGAKNVEIVTNGGVVTLRGLVKSGAEKSGIDQKARAWAGNNRVDDDLEVESHN
jgi:osmotically-inducible protein OsmY